MKRLLGLLLSLLLLLGCAAEAPKDAFCAFTDDAGAAVTLERRPRTVAVLTSSLADLWRTAGGSVDITVGEAVERGFAGESAVLVDEGAGKTVNLELLIAAKPDLVIYSPELSGQVSCAQALRSAGIPAAAFSVEDFSDYLRLLELSCSILGTPERYETYGEALRLRVEALIGSVQGRTPPDILFVRAGSSARYTKAKTAENHFVCRMLQELGAHNIADDAPILLDGLSTEQILLADPDRIFYTTMGDEATGTAYMESLLADPVWQAMTAVKSGQVHQLPKELFQYKPNARWDEAYAYLIGLLYGENT